MRATHTPQLRDVNRYEAQFSASTERLLLYLVLGAGYGFLGFFGWLLTL